jgi:pimeloyl-ACP methyl ester carboxylesterase
MNTTVWPEENGGALLRDSLKLEARRWHQLHQAPSTVAEWEPYRAQLLRQLQLAAGPSPEPCPLAVQEYGTLPLDGYRVTRISYRSRPDVRVTANLYVPEGPGPFPGVLSVHGHWQQGKVAARVAARGHLLAKAGFVVLAVDAFGSGERGTVAGQYEYHGAQVGAALLSLGETLLGAQVWDNQRGLDLLQSLPCVDGERLGVTGASGGGNQTMWLAAFDPRIRAAVPVVSVGSFESYICTPNCVCEMLPRGLTLTEEWAILALAAPGALLVLNALRESNPAFFVSEMLRSFNPAQDLYRALGLGDRVDYRALDLTHGYWPEMQRHMLGWFRYWLKGDGTGRPCDVPVYADLPERDLLCFPDHERPADVCSITDYATRHGRRLKAAALARPLPAAALRRDLAALLGADLAAPAQYLRGPRVARPADELLTETFTLAGPHGAMLPCVLARRQEATPRGTLLAVHPKGKGAAVESATVSAALKAGRQVCLVDLRNLGESRWDAGQVRPEHEAARSALWLGRTLIGEWVEDLLAVARVLATDGPVDLVAWGEPGLAALAAAALDERAFATVETLGVLASYVLDGKAHTQSMSIFVPGLLNWGDVSLMAALAHAPVTLLAPLGSSGQSLDATACSTLAGEIRELAVKLDRQADVCVKP